MPKLYEEILENKQPAGYRGMERERSNQREREKERLVERPLRPHTYKWRSYLGIGPPSSNTIRCYQMSRYQLSSQDLPEVLTNSRNITKTKQIFKAVVCLAEVDKHNKYLFRRCKMKFISCEKIISLYFLCSN